jgi:putative 2OG-Fe(II) oxygenase
MKISVSEINNENSEVIEQLKLFGFVNARQLALSVQESNELASLTKETFSHLNHDHPHFLNDEIGVTGMRGLPLHNDKITEILNKIVSNKSVKNVLEKVLGPDYKIWQIDYRRSVRGDKGLQLHQDGMGQLNMGILLSDNMTSDGSTVFLPQSHLVIRRIRDLRLELSPRLIKSFSFLFSYITGKVGDISFFFNRTWHGRCPNNSDRDNDIILIGFFPAGAAMSFLPPYVNWPVDFLENIKDTELGRLMNPSIGTEQQSNGLLKIISKQNNSLKELPYSLAIESKQENQGNFKLRIIVIFLKVAMGGGRPFKVMFRKFKGKLAQ